MANSRTLILNIDRDDDIGFKADIVSPVVGREACLDAAVRLALADPEDSDVNAIFQTISTYDKLKTEGEDVAIAIIGGNHFHFIEGDRKIARLLADVISTTGSQQCILVTDGGEDEYVLPIIQAKIPISSIQRVVVSQMPNLEGTYYILKKLLSDPKISKFVLVLPGLTLLLYAITYAVNRPEIATMIIAAAIGGYLLYKGFSLDEFIKNELTDLKTTLYRGRFSFITYIGGIIFAATGIMDGSSNLTNYWDGVGILPMIMIFIWGSIFWLTVAGLTMSLGSIIDNALYDRESLNRSVILSFFISATGILIYGGMSYSLSNAGLRSFPIPPDLGVAYMGQGAVIALICALIGILLQHMLYRWVEEVSGKKELLRTV